MILQSLTNYYETLLESGSISPPGWDDSCKVSYGLELDDTGEIVSVIPYQTTVIQAKKEKILTFRQMRVPARVKRSSGISANFLCDTSSYLLGVDTKGKPERAKDCFQACRKRHEELLAESDTPAAKAILTYFAAWNPDTAKGHPVLSSCWDEILSGGNLIFCYHMNPVVEDREIVRIWQQYYNTGQEDVMQGQCLVTGVSGSIAKLHPSIKGVQGAQSSGASLISFNAPAFESYGHSQGGNAPVGEYAAFAYASALNALLADREHCRTIGDTTVVCWAENGQNAYQDLGMFSIFGSPEGIDDKMVVSVLHKMAKGERCTWKDISINPNEHFYYLGLAPNASRLSVRFFLRDSFGNFMRNLDRHYQDTSIIRPAYDAREDLSIWQLLNETVNQNSRNKNASPQMTGSVLQSILTGTRYPATLLNGAEIRIRSERNVTRGRAAIIKAYYLRSPHPDCPKEVLQMELNENSTNVAYTLGRLFSVYEQIQQKANPDINATIKDKYFNSASASPAIVFPMLGNLAQKHLRVIRREQPGAAVNLERRLGELSVIIGKEFPERMNLAEQGSFQLGYYFENQARYQKKEEKNV